MKGSGGATGGSGGSTGGSGGATGGSSGVDDAGMGDATVDAGSQPCDGACGGGTPVCDESSDTCVECVGDGDCGSEFCVDNACVECRTNLDCGNISGIQIACSMIDNTCATNDHSANVCQRCVADSQCQIGQLCVMQTFGTPAEDVGYFCAWDKDAPAPGPSGDCSTVRPYIRELLNAQSIDGVMADLCALMLSTCEAFNDNGNPCGDGNPPGSTGVAHDDLCGFAHSAETPADGTNVDAYCVDNGDAVNPLRCASICNNQANGNYYCPAGTMCENVGGHYVCVAH